MPTSVHIPPQLLAAVDERAKRLAISRNRFVVRTLEEAVARDDGWDPAFFDELERVGPSLSGDVDTMMRAIRSKRTAKRPPRL